MCLIIQRKPQFELPFEKFKTAIINNPDGYGLTFIDEGKLQVIRTPEEPDPEKLYRMVNEELIDKDIMLHLRYTTAGATNLRNAHPFPILEKSKDGVDLRMCHNGTLFKYKPKEGDESDTRNFVRSYVRPLFKRLVRGCEPEELLKDDFVKDLLEDQLSAASVLTFMDSEGNTMICNETGNGGKKEDEWYYSNTYSFNPSHRSKSVVGKPTTRTTGTTSMTTVTGGGTTGGFASDINLRLFSEKFKLASIRDVKHLTDDTIHAILSLVDKTNAELLIKELIREVTTLDKVANRLYRENERLKRDVKTHN